MALAVASKNICEELCRKRIKLEMEINGMNSIDFVKCVKICRGLAKG